MAQLSSYLDPPPTITEKISIHTNAQFQHDATIYAADAKSAHAFVNKLQPIRLFKAPFSLSLPHFANKFPV